MQPRINRKEFLFTRKVLKGMKDCGISLTGKNGEIQNILVGCSGGADSVALLLALYYCRDILGQRYNIQVISVNHGIRPESVDECEFVRELSSMLKIKCEVINLHLKDGKGIMEEARNIRYNAILSLMVEYRKQLGYKFTLAFAHHKDDQAETLLMRMLGLCSSGDIKPIPKRRKIEGTSFEVIRPMLDITRAEIEDFLNDINYVKDPTNENTKYTRNRLRHEIIPFLKHYNPDLVTSIVKRFG